MKIFNKVSVAVLLSSFAIASFGITTAIAAGPAGINLGTAGDYAILSKTGISTTGTTKVVGDMGVSPIAASAITGFSLTLPSASAFSTSALVTGNVYAPDYASPTPINLTTAIGDMQTAYTDGAGRSDYTATELGAGNIGGLTIVPGLYKWGTGVLVPTNVTLSGGANDVWIFQIAQNLNVSSDVQIILAGGAQASNVYWIVAGQTTVGTSAIFNGNILDETAIVFNTGSTLNGRALAQTAVILDATAVTKPSSTTGNPSFATSQGASTSTVTVAQAININSIVTNNGSSVGSIIVDVEVYNSSNQKVFQKFYELQNFEQGQTQTYNTSFIPSAVGSYTVKIGIFNYNWSQNYLWVDNALGIQVGGSTPTIGRQIDIWWPTQGANIGGSHMPFKGLLRDTDVNDYDMHWQVDGGQLVNIPTNYTDYPHKQFDVDLTNWTWRGTGPYHLNFIAKDRSGNVLSQQSIDVTVWH
ncbi:MAG: ice-binding family protein [bacterium]|nr:ice-binding family protein [bacterium]